MSKEPHPSPKAQFDPLVDELILKVRDMSPIIFFLNSLNDDNFGKTIPKAVPSGLKVGGSIHLMPIIGFYIYIRNGVEIDLQI